MEIRIRGRVLGYSDDVAAGVIQAEDGNKYQFERAEWRSAVNPAARGTVTFATRSGKAVLVDGD